MTAQRALRARAAVIPKSVSLAAVLLLGVLGAQAAAAETDARTPVLTTPDFAFFSDFETNLNDALIEAGRARKDSKNELFQGGDAGACFAALDPSARAGWNEAVDFYTAIVSPADWGDPPQFGIRVDLAGFAEALEDDNARQYVRIVAGMRAAAAPAYRACRWTAQDEKNRRWIDALGALLRIHEAKIAARLQDVYQKRWLRLPIPVDVVEVVNWAGANSILIRGGGHLLVSSSEGGDAALETVFHEASHILMGRNAPVRQALESAASVSGYTLPRDLWHIVLFDTTGEVVREELAATGPAGRPGYTPMLHEIYGRGPAWGKYRRAIETAWHPYVQGRTGLLQAAANLIAELQKPN